MYLNMYLSAMYLRKLYSEAFWSWKTSFFWNFQYSENHRILLKINYFYLYEFLSIEIFLWRAKFFVMWTINRPSISCAEKKNFFPRARLH